MTNNITNEEKGIGIFKVIAIVGFVLYSAMAALELFDITFRLLPWLSVLAIIVAGCGYIGIYTRTKDIFDAVICGSLITSAVLLLASSNVSYPGITKLVLDFVTYAFYLFMMLKEIPKKRASLAVMTCGMFFLMMLISIIGVVKSYYPFTTTMLHIVSDISYVLGGVVGIIYTSRQ